ncbi:MAG: DUF4390 domain-containing protein [Gallionella sp.]|nr:DUF4390 domain-containing protein [Gallionella sp.]
MADDRKSSDLFLRPDESLRFCMACFKRGILAVVCLLMKLLAIPLGNPPTIAKWLVMSFVLCPMLASAEGISVNKAEARLSEDGYQLSASYNVNLTFAAQQALERGVPLYFVGEFLLTRPRWYWLDEEIFQSEHTVKLSYNVLTRQYRISRGALFQNFASLEDALNILARQSSTVIPAEVVSKDGSYIAAARLRLDVAQLPKLLQVNALTGKDWTLNSDWYRWVINTAEMTVNSEGKTE